MQNRMKTHQLSKEQMENLLSRCMTGTLATISEDNTPYIIPIHYVYMDGSIYFHGLGKGKKVDNILACPNVCFNVYEMDGLLLPNNGRPCSTNTKYQSVTVFGEAQIIENFDGKLAALIAIAKKYTHQLRGEISSSAVEKTMVVKITVSKMTGKYYG